MDALYILKTALKKIENPEDWGKGRRRYEREVDTCCAAEAIEESGPADGERFRAIRALCNAAGLPSPYSKLTDWNDAPKRTYAEVVAAFKLAIATLRLE